MARKKKNLKATLAWILYSLGLLIIFGSHIMIFSSGLPEKLQNIHATLNIIAGALVILATIIGMKS